MTTRNTVAESIFEEIRGIAPQKSCCQKAHLCGLVYNCRIDADGKTFIAFFRRETDALRAADIINHRFGGRAVPEDATRGGHKGYEVCFNSKALSMVFCDIDGKRVDNASDAVGFRCPECEASFMRGVFLSSASVIQPKNGYRLEISLENSARADIVSDVLSNTVASVGRTERSGRTVLYYRSNVKISDLLYRLGALSTGFELANISIERAIRNNENRATNCVAHNISRSVGASRKHVDAINYIMEREKMALLDDELQVTARLRVENPSVSLSELAALHNPPITKSGVNSRLTKILLVADELKDK